MQIAIRPNDLADNIIITQPAKVATVGTGGQVVADYEYLLLLVIDALDSLQFFFAEMGNYDYLAGADPPKKAGGYDFLTGFKIWRHAVTHDSPQKKWLPHSLKLNRS